MQENMDIYPSEPFSSICRSPCNSSVLVLLSTDNEMRMMVIIVVVVIHGVEDY